MRKLTLLLLGLTLFVGAAMAQRTVSGVVTDDKGTALPNVSVLVKGGTTGTSTKADGSFTLTVPAKATSLIFSSVGMQPQELTLTSSSSYSVSMQSANNDLNEVVVVGYGSAKKKSEIVGSVTTISAAQIQNRPSANAFDALQGRIPGLQVYTSSGEPSQSSSLRLHGSGSLGSSTTPLYVMDGIPVDPGTIVSLNSSDWESVSVLKDASAAAIYGSRAANGVIFITTKKGSSNNPTISLDAQYGVSSLIGTTEDMYNGFMNAKELTDFWVATNYASRAYVDNLLANNPFDTKWYKVYYKDNRPSYQLNLSMSGGSGKTTYFVSGGYFKQEGLAYRSGFERYTVRANVTSNINKWMTFGMNLSGGYDKRQTNQYGTNNTNRGLALLAPPFYSPVDQNGVPYPTVIPGWGRYQPEYLADKMPSPLTNLQLNPSGYVQIMPIRGLILKSQAGIEFYDDRTTSIRYPSYAGSLNFGSVTEAFQRGVSRTITNTGEYKFTIARDHKFTALLGQEYTDYNYKDFYGSSTGQTDDRLVLVASGTTKDAGTYAANPTSNAYVSYFSRIDYSLFDKYTLGISGRQDQSSRFGKDNRTARFWSVGGMWDIKKEPFMKDVSFVNALAFKASIGTSGNSAVRDFENLSLTSTINSENVVGFSLNSPGNSRLGWEKQRMINFGIRAGLFNRINVDIDLYDRLTTDLYIAVPYPYTAGFNSITTNTGSLQNRGIDVGLSGDIIRTKDAFLTPYINFNYNKEKVLELFQDRNYWIIPSTGVAWAVGQPVNFIYPLFKGINSQTGLPEWYLPDPNPDNVVNKTTDKGVTSTFNATALQQSTGIKRYAPFTGGFGLSGGYKGFSLAVDLSFAQGKYLINNDRYFFENPNQFAGFNQSRVILDYWKQPGDVTRFPKYGVQFTQFDSRLIENASFVRIKNMSIGYDLPKRLLQKTNVFKAAKIYVEGRNLVTWTKYTGPDPEVDSNLTLGVNPNTRQMAVGFRFQF